MTGTRSPSITAAVARARANLAGRAGGAALPPAAPTGHADRPLTGPQRSLWLLNQLRDRPHDLHVSWARRLLGGTDVAALAAALRATIARHPALTSTFHQVGGQPEQRPGRPQPDAVRVLDLRAEPDAGDRARALLTAHREERFDLARGPNARALVVRLTDDGETWVGLTVHHLVFDAASQRTVLADLSAAYRALRRGEPLPWSKPVAPPPQPARTATTAGAAARLDDPPRPPRTIPPGDAPAGPPGQAGIARTTLDAALVREIRALTGSLGASHPMLFLALTAELLARHGAGRDILIGTPMDTRPPGGAEWVGCYVNTVPVRIRTEDDPTVEALLRRTRSAVAEALRDRDLPLEEVVRALRDAGQLDGRPLFEVACNFIDGGVYEAALDGVESRTIDLSTGSAQFGLVLTVTDDGDTMDLTAEFDRGFVGARLAGQLLPRLRSLLAAAVAAPGSRVGALPMPGPAEPVTRPATAGAEPVDRFRAPVGPVEHAVAELYAQVLGLRRQVGRDESFFRLGGHSFLVLRMVAALREGCGLDAHMRDVFDHPTVAGLAAALAERPRTASDRSPVDGGSEPDRPSPAQEQLWFVDKAHPCTPLYTVPLVFRVLGPLDLYALSVAVEQTVRAHPALRARFPESGGRPRLAYRDAEDIPVQVHDIAQAPAGEVRRVVHSLTRHVFDLSSGPLFRIDVITEAAGRHLVVLAAHHIVLDGASVPPLLATLSEAYARELEGVPHPEPAGVPAAARPLPGDEAAARLAATVHRLRGVPEELTLPTDRPRAAAPSFAGGSVRAELDRAVVARLRGLTADHEVTLFSTLLAGVGALLSRYGAGADVVIGCPSGGRRATADLDGVVGYFVNLLPVRIDLSADPSLSACVDRARDALRAAQLDEVDFGAVVRALAPGRSAGRAPLVQVSCQLTHLDAEPVLALPGCRAEQLAVADDLPAKFDLAFSFAERPAGGLEVAITYARDLFDEATVMRLLDSLLRLLTVGGDAPEVPVSRLGVLTESELAHLLDLARGRITEVPAARVDEQVYAIAARRPDALAVADAASSLSYRQLVERSDVLAAGLRERGVRPGDVVAIELPRSVDHIVAMLATLRAGAAYVSIETGLPAARRCDMLDQAGPAAVIGESGRVTVTGSAAAPPGGAPADVAYVMYTSGSTGRPKGVEVRHAGLANLVASLRRSHRLGPGDVIAQHVRLGFDVSVLEIWTALTCGATLRMAPDGLLHDLDSTVSWLDEHAVSILWLPPAVGARVLRQPRHPAALRTLLVGGEALTARPRRGLGFEVVNTYGPTEATVFVSEVVIEPDGGMPPIGRPLDNCEMYVLDRWLAPVPRGVVGELYLGGVALARGYLGQPAATAASFVPHPFAAGRRLYRSGDLARWLPSGELEFVGRADRQVKIRGFRVELGEVEYAVAACPGIQQAAVTAVDDGLGSRRLVAYVVGTTDEKALLARLRLTLPEYMLPALVWLDELPVTPNGKVDRRRLPRVHVPAARTGEAPAAGMERQLAELFGEVLGLPSGSIGRDDGFFALGGHSIAVMDLVHAARRRGIDLLVLDVLERQTPRALATTTRGRHEGGHG